MTETYRIVVGVDFGPSGEEAFRMAMELGREIPHAELHLTAVVVEHTQSPSATRIAIDERLVEDASARLRDYIESKRVAYEGAEFSRPVVHHVRLGDAAEALHQVAVDVDARLIIVGTRGTRGLARLVLGSVSERLVKLAKVPVLVARPNELAGMEKSITRPEAPRPGQTEADLHAPASYERRSVMEFGARTTRVAGNI